MQNFTTNKLTFWVLCFFLLVFVELTIFNNGGAFCLIIGAILLYLSFSKNIRFLKWTGIFFIAISLFTMWSLRLFIVILLLYMLYQYLQRENEPKIVTLEFEKLPASKNELFGTIPAPVDAYKWQDVQIQRLAGDITIDTTQTILPAGQSLVTIRQGIGKVQIYVPYEIPFRLHYTTLFGDFTCLQGSPQRLMNESIVFSDGNPEDAKRTLVIHVATWLGDLEVLRK
ncbi:cell wall-active antibiotics response protein LiaF [Lysinibacillus sp. CD3-6]|uniref:cell wall-active antibiotics response protein LiaF n=1 Tax=Lysinibacillus sp. CD3-6 TaxID=2892541 RepID=UPI00117461EA|nr:cell wall-active antibiotics response protein LiaF [Lysinibacillus sp. CD3-6]UED81556.1 cell wall-active antibiotics response protein LiaF [Lysinibacillus sp. CD3-6]